MFLFQNVQVETIAFGEGDGGLLVADHKDVANAGGEGLAAVVADVSDVEAAGVLLDVHEVTHSTDVVSAGDVAQLAGLVLDPRDDLVLLEVVLDGVSLADLGVGEADGSRVVGHDVGDLVGAESLALDLEELVLGLALLDADEGESALDVVEHAVVLVGLDDGEDVHDSDGELGVSADLVVDAEAVLLVIEGEGDLAAGECEVESLPELDTMNLMMMERGRHSRSLWGPWLGRVA